MQFTSPTKGKLSERDMYEDILSFVRDNPGNRYRLIVGTDSQVGRETCFVTAVIIHREGKGARYYYRRTYQKTPVSLRYRIIEEATRSLEMAGKIIEYMSNINPDLTIEIHCDIGEKGKTRELIQQVVKMINMSGFLVRVKPFSYGASTVADRYTK